MARVGNDGGNILPERSAQDLPPFICQLAGQSDQILFIKRVIDVVAPSDAAVLITGETGTGKELLARRVHGMSNRRNQPFVPMNCAAIPDNLVESELFGFEKGAFTGACSRQEGRLQQAHGGTLFLDEIGDLSCAAQAKLLRALEQKEVQPLGSRTARVLDFRVIAATNRDLEQLAAGEKFRQDLFFRLNVVQIDIPPLRERRDDIVPIACHFLEEFRSQYGRAAIKLTRGAQRWLERQPWLGNARELRNVIERAFLFADSWDITEEDVTRLCHSGMRWRVGTPRGQLTSFHRGPKDQPRYRTARTNYRQPQMEFSGGSEADRLRAALEKTKWNKSKAAELLHCSRMTVYRKVVQYDISPPDVEPGEEFTKRDPTR